MPFVACDDGCRTALFGSLIKVSLIVDEGVHYTTDGFVKTQMQSPSAIEPLL
jgi:hypothetical protein